MRDRRTSSTTFLIFCVIIVLFFLIGYFIGDWSGRISERVQIDEADMLEMAIVRGRLEKCTIQRDIYLAAIKKPNIEELRAELGIINEW